MSRATARRFSIPPPILTGLNTLLNDPLFTDRTGPDHCDFLLGNPHDPPLPGFVEALRRGAVPQNKDWFAYKLSEPEATSVVLETLNRGGDAGYRHEHIVMTNGTFGGLTVALNALVDPGDEVIFVSPPWFFYELMISSVGATPVRVFADRQTFQLDLSAIAAAISPRTRGIIVNSPNNPGGTVYPPDDLTELGRLLSQASDKAGRPVYLLSDEAYKRILFDGIEYSSPTDFYDCSLMLYTYGKTLLTPGERLGYIAINPAMPDAGEVAQAMFFAQTICGWAFPNSVLQHALADIEKLTIDVGHVQRKRDLVVRSLRESGYVTTNPSGTFYVVIRSPWKEDLAFTRMLARQGVFVLPGSTFELPGHFRISLTANDHMIDRALPILAEAIRHPAP